MKKKTDGVHLHGEAMIFSVPSIPAKAKAVKTANQPYVIIAPSETTGNHHVIDCVEGVDFFQDGETLFMKSTVPATVRCLQPQRHDEATIAPGTYQIGSQLEYDPFKARLEKVRD